MYVQSQKVLVEGLRFWLCSGEGGMMALRLTPQCIVDFAAVFLG